MALKAIQKWPSQCLANNMKKETRVYVAKKISEGPPKVPSDTYFCSECQEGLHIAKDCVDFALNKTIILCMGCAEKVFIKNKEKWSLYKMKGGKPTPL